MLHHLKRWDRSLLLWMQEHLRKGGVTLFMKITTFLGNGGIIWIAACLCLLFRPEARRAAASGLISLLFSVMINNAMLKNLVARIRPFDHIHELKIFLCMLPLWIGISALLLASLIAFSRLYLGAHYPSDVLCGMLLGILFAFLAQILVHVLLDNCTWMPEAIRLWFPKA